jgi:hypothetical protein
VVWERVLEGAAAALQGAACTQLPGLWAAPAAHLAAVLQHLDRDGRGGHGQRAAQDDGRGARQPRQAGRRQAHTQQREHDLQRTRAGEACPLPSAACSARSKQPSGAAGSTRTWRPRRARARSHLCRAHAKHVFGHGLQALQGQLQADVEQQEHDTQLRQVLHCVHVADDVERVRAQQRAANLRVG